MAELREVLRFRREEREWVRAEGAEAVKSEISGISDGGVRRLFRSFLGFCLRVGGKPRFRHYRSGEYEEAWISCELPEPKLASIAHSGGHVRGILNLYVEPGALASIATEPKWSVKIEASMPRTREISLLARKETITPEAYEWSITASMK